MRFITGAMLLLLAGCGEREPMANKDIVAQVAFCEGHKLHAVPMYQPMDTSGDAIVAIQCKP